MASGDGGLGPTPWQGPGLEPRGPPGPAFLRRCLPDKAGKASCVEPVLKEETSSWRLASIQDSLCELIKQNAGLHRAVREVSELQQELRQCLSESQRCLESQLGSLLEKGALEQLPSATETTSRPFVVNNAGAVTLQSETAKHFQSEPAKPVQSEVKPAVHMASGAVSSPRSARLPARAAFSEANGTAQVSESRSGSKAPGPDQCRVQAVISAATQHSVKRQPAIVRFVKSPAFDTAMGILIALNFATIYAEIDLKAWDLDFKLGNRENSGEWPMAKTSFNGVEATFNGLFLCELLIRILVQGIYYFKSPLDVLDALVIVCSCVDSFILDNFTDGFRHARILGLLRVTRVLRALRMLRFIRVLKMMKFLGPLRVLVHTIAMSMDSLAWSLVVMGCIIVCSALLMVNLVTDFLEDESQELEDREWVFMYFGSATRATYTMFEASFSGIWASRLSRKMINVISPWFMLYWFLYVVTVNFAVMRVISALFLKRTLDVAQVDAERLAMAQTEKKERVMATIREVFRLADQLGDGTLHRWEFDAMMENPEVLKLFAEVELESNELHLLYNLLYTEGGVEREEFLAGAMKLKAVGVKPVDVVQIMHEQCVLRRHIDDIKMGMEYMDAVLHPTSPWRPMNSSAKRASFLAPEAMSTGKREATTACLAD